MKRVLRFVLAVGMFFHFSHQGESANILWVSDAPAAGFSGPGTNLTDQGFISLLQAAGHNVNRFNPPDAAATPLSVEDLAAINTNDLVILGKAITSTPFTDVQGRQWNTNVTIPLVCVNAYLTRQNRLGWFTANNIPDSTTSRLTAAVTNSLTDFLFGNVAMRGNTTLEVYDELLDRNTTHITDPLVTGGEALVTTTFVREDNGQTATATAIAELPAGTTVRGSDILPAYRLYFSTSHRESSTAPNGVSTHSGRETLSETGEAVFHRAVELALNSGVPPISTENLAFDEEPEEQIFAVEGWPLTLNAKVNGEGPRVLEWQRSTDDGITFTNVPGATTPFGATSLVFPALTLAEDQAKFRIFASNAVGSITSRVVNLNVQPDTEGPMLANASSIDGRSIVLYFNEPLDSTRNTATDPINYQLSSGTDAYVFSAALRPDLLSVQLELSAPITGSYTLQVEGVMDQFGNGMTPASIEGIHQGLNSATIGSLNPPGTNVAGYLGSLDLGPAPSIDITAGGLDIAGAADQLQLSYNTFEGDFDAQVRVLSLFGTNRHESNAKAILTARESLDPGSRAVTIYATPPAPADNVSTMLVRSFASSTPAVTGTPLSNAGATNLCLRLKREGDVFTTYVRPQVSQDWVEVGSTTLPLPASVILGIGAVSHRNGQVTTARFTDFTVNTGGDPQAVTISNPS